MLRSDEPIQQGNETIFEMELVKEAVCILLYCYIDISVLSVLHISYITYTNEYIYISNAYIYICIYNI